MNICENIEIVREEIEEARRHSLTGEPVELIAVTKTHPIEFIEEAMDCGITAIGENKVQELEKKIQLLDKKGKKSDVSYHMIGSLQSNKVKYIYQDIALIHSLDRKSLAKEINRRGKQTDTVVNCLLQVNITRESHKGGLLIKNVIPFLESILDSPYIKVNGLMAMAPFTDDEKLIRESFRKVFKLREEIENSNYEGVNMDILSMGMSQDYQIAIEEGSNMVRVGSRIFGARDYSK